MANPVELLIQEHEVISKALHNVLALESFIQTNPEKFRNEMKTYIGFFRNYADQFHHMKEERILFVQMKNLKEGIGDGVIKEMYDNHSDFREMLTEIETLNDAGNLVETFKAFKNYSNALFDHIAVEDYEIFQMALSIFSDEQLEKMAFQFDDTDRDLGKDYKKSMEDFVK